MICRWNRLRFLWIIAECVCVCSCLWLRETYTMLQRCPLCLYSLCTTHVCYYRLVECLLATICNWRFSKQFFFGAQFCYFEVESIRLHWTIFFFYFFVAFTFHVCVQFRWQQLIECVSVCSQSTNIVLYGECIVKHFSIYTPRNECMNRNRSNRVYGIC